MEGGAVEYLCVEWGGAMEWLFILLSVMLYASRVCTVHTPYFTLPSDLPGTQAQHLSSWIPVYFYRVLSSTDMGV